MTARQAYEAVLVELDKVQAPTILLDDFNYLFNKCISAYVNTLFPKRAEFKQEDVDKIMTLVSSVELEADGQSYVYLPDDYLHLLSCFCSFSGVPSVCSDGSLSGIPARHLNPSRTQEIAVNYYLKPKATRPYYTFKYENMGKVESSNNYDVDIQERYDVKSYIDNAGSNFRRKYEMFDVDGNILGETSVINREQAVRYGRPTRAKLVIEHGGEGTFEGVSVDYVKAPQFVRLTPEQMDLVEDTSQILEWDDLVCYELIAQTVESVKATNNTTTNVKQ